MLRLPRAGIASTSLDRIRVVGGAAELAEARAEVDATHVSDELLGYLVAVVRATRTLPSVELGASPRAAVHMLGAARMRARLIGRDYVTPDDIREVAPAVLAHRLVLRPEAELDRYLPADAVQTALSQIPVPR